jgi:lysozyme
MKSLLPVTVSALFVLSGCNSSSMLDSMEGVDKRDLITGSVRAEAPSDPKTAIEDKTVARNAADAASPQDVPDTAAVRTEGPSGSDLDLINAMSGGDKPSPAASQTSTIVNPPISAKSAKRAGTPVQVASLRPKKIKTRSSDAFRNTKIYKARFSDAKPIDFGRASPKYFAVHGVDVSRWQYDIDWNKLRTRGANFAFIKATEGGDHLDPMFKKNWDAAAKAGVPRGAYHFFYWCRVAEQQADWFIRNVPKVKGALPPVIDVEWNNHSKSCPRRPSRKVVLEKMRVFMKKVEAHYGQKPIIYTAPDFYEDNLQGQFKGYTFWLRSVAAHPKKRYPNREFLFWQYSGTGVSKGVDTKIDLNVFNGSEKAWRNWLAKSVL